MTTLLKDEAAELIYRTVSVLHSFASTLTGEAKSELATLQKLLAQTEALPRDQTDALSAGLAQVRQHWMMGDKEDCIGDGNRLWAVFVAAWALREHVVAQGLDGKQRVLESIAYTIECIAQDAHGDANEELASIAAKLKDDASYRFNGADEVLVNIESARADYANFERRRYALGTLCKLSRELWSSLSG